MIKLGFVSAILPDLGFEEVVSFAAQEGFSCLELMCWPRGKAERRYAGVTHVDVDSLAAGDVARMQKLLAEKKVSISGLGYYPNPLDPDEKNAAFYRSHIKKVISAAAALGVGVVNTFIGRDPAKSLEENFKRFAAVWPEIVTFAEAKGVKIGIENCPMFFSMDEWPGGKNLAISPSVWRRMFAEIPSKSFGLNYDPSHLLWQQIDYVKPLYEFKERIFHVHVKDAKIRRDRIDDVGILATPLEFHTPKLPGLGDVDWGRFVSALTDIGYGGMACIEVEDRAFEDSLESRKASLVQSRRYMAQFIPA
jgi:sugar phosphate isomerase/epimerase